MWWCELTAGEFRQRLAQGSDAERAYWLAALMREANTRDVWLFASVSEIKRLWPLAYRHLGRSKGLWEFLLKLPAPSGDSRAA